MGFGRGRVPAGRKLLVDGHPQTSGVPRGTDHAGSAGIPALKGWAIIRDTRPAAQPIRPTADGSGEPAGSPRSDT